MGCLRPRRCRECGAPITARATYCVHCRFLGDRYPGRRAVQKTCIDCGAPIVREATRCQRCKQLGSRNPNSHPPEERFWAKVARSDRGQCWEWLGARAHAYGRFSLNRRPMQAHVFAYETEYGPVAPGTELHHTCLNPGCVNPAHLVAVTRSEHKRIHARIQKEEVAA